MRAKSFIQDNSGLIPLIISGVICISLILLLWNKLAVDDLFLTTLENILSITLIISGVIAISLMLYLTIVVVTIKKNRSNIVSDLDMYTQKMHSFRTIIELLLHSKMWLPGLKSYLDEEYANLNYFEVKEFYRGYSKLAIEFLQENHPYQDTENLYLEFKALLITSPKEKKLPENIHYPKHYDKAIVEKWLEHKCGSGLWFYFGYKYGTFKSALDIDAVYERHQDKIMALAQSIDSTAFEDSSFNEVFLAKLGEYMNKDVLPKLHQYQSFASQKLPKTLNYVYILFLCFGLIGVLLPIFYLLFQLDTFLLILSIAIPISLMVYMAASFYQFLIREVEV